MSTTSEAGTPTIEVSETKEAILSNKLSNIKKSRPSLKITTTKDKLKPLAESSANATSIRSGTSRTHGMLRNMPSAGIIKNTGKPSLNIAGRTQ